MEQAFGSNNIAVNTYSTGSSQSKPTQASELKDYYQKFLNSTGDKAMVRLIVVPYKLVEDYPWENPLEGNTKEDYIGMMVVGLWELKAAIADANFILNPTTANMFALGFNNSVKNRRINYIKQQRNTWQREYDMLLGAAQKCDANFDNKCKELAEYYDRHRNLAAQWHAIMPERYLSDCYQSRIIDPTSSLKNRLVQQNFATPVKGDSEEGGSTGRVVAKLKLKKDQRQLKADLAVAKIEWKRKEWRNQPLEVRSNKGESGWGLATQAILVDLDKPQQYGLGQENLKYCTWQGDGYKRMEIKSPPARDYFFRFGLQQIPVQGYIDGITGKDPRGQQRFGGGQGYLDFISCEVDRKGKDNNMQCLDLGMRNIPLMLSSSQDLQADRWQAPTTPQVPTVLANFSTNKPLSVQQNAAQFKSFTNLVPASQKKALSKNNAQKATVSRKFKSTHYKLPGAQLQLMQKRLQPATIKKLQLKPLKQ